MYKRKYKTKFKLLFKLLYLILMATPVECQGPSAHMTKQDRMGRADKEKMIHLTDDLVKDAHLKMRQIFDIRTEHEIYVSFNVGVVIGKINEKFRNMIEVYKDILDKGRVRHNFLGPGINFLRTLHFVIAMEMVHALEVEIDNFINVLERAAAKDFEEDNLIVGETMESMRAGKERAAEEEEEIKKEAEEELAKSMMREQYLMKRLGLPLNTTTTKKRFMDHWPVEETWSFENNPLY